MDDLSQRIAKLSPEQVKLLSKRLGHAGMGVAQAGVLPHDHGDIFPLSYTQERFWFLNQLSPGHLAYNLSMGFRSGLLFDMSVVERCMNEIVQRHEILRTCFPVVDGRPVQKVVHTPPIKMSLIDVSQVPKQDREVAGLRLAAEEVKRPFNLADGPLVRPVLIRLDENDHIFLVTIHHILADGWSLKIFIRELAILYQAFSAGRDSPLPPLRIQFADFAVWQRNTLQGEVLERLLSYWKEQLKDLPVFEVAPDRPRPSVYSYDGAAERVVIPRILIDRLKVLGREQRASLFMVLLAAFKVMLCRYTGQDDVVIGIPIANRNRSEFEGVVGPFVNSLVLRTDLYGNPSFAEALARVRQVCLGAFAHQDLPFERLVSELNPPRNLDRNPLFQVALHFEDTPGLGLRIGEISNLTMSPVEVGRVTAVVDLELRLWEGVEGFLMYGQASRGSMGDSSQGVFGSLVYNSRLYDDSTIARMVEHYLVLLESIVNDPHQRILELPLLTESERSQVLINWNDTHRLYPEEKVINELLEAQADRTPDSVAVVFEDEMITYRELNARANRVARYLQELGVGPEVPVGVHMERSAEMIISLLGAWKAGGVYLPLGTELPLTRVMYMLEDAGAMVLITQEKFLPQFAEFGGLVVCLDRDWKVIEKQSAANLGRIVRPENLAYVIYTSGSTGKPKGVMLAHRGLCNLSEAQTQVFGLEPDDRVLQFAPPGFDASIWEVTSLREGAALVVVPKASLLPGKTLMKLLEEKAISTVTLPPSALSFSLATKLPALRTIIVAGETCTAEIAARWAEGRCFFNAYGPTEGTVCTTVCKTSAAGRNPPIGRPIPNVRVFILDPLFRPVPIGVTGELFIGGDGVARGYLNRPDLTAEKFLPSPFESEPGKRLYQTGDLARWRADGNIEFEGRIDHQVKIRGYRVELGEIEATLRQHPGIQQAVVSMGGGGSGGERLVSYIIPNGKQELTTVDVRTYLKDRLPEFMVPSLMVFLEALPVTSSGKVDRSALPAADLQRPELLTSYIAPRTEIERTLVTIWQRALAVEKVGVNDNFFDLGGNSLLLVQVHNDLQETLDREISIIDLFRFPTIASLADSLGGQPPEKDDSEARTAEVKSRKEGIQRRRKARQDYRGL